MAQTYNQDVDLSNYSIRHRRTALEAQLEQDMIDQTLRGKLKKKDKHTAFVAGAAAVSGLVGAYLGMNFGYELAQHYNITAPYLTVPISFVSGAVSGAITGASALNFTHRLDDLLQERAWPRGTLESTKTAYQYAAKGGILGSVALGVAGYIWGSLISESIPDHQSMSLIAKSGLAYASACVSGTFAGTLFGNFAGRLTGGLINGARDVKNTLWG